MSAFDNNVLLTPDDEYLEWHASVLRVALALGRADLAEKHIDQVVYSANRRLGRLLLLLAKYCGRHADLVHTYGLMVHMCVLLCPTKAFRDELRHMLLSTNSEIIPDASRPPSDIMMQTLDATARIVSTCTDVLAFESRVLTTLGGISVVDDNAIEHMLVSVQCVPTLKFWKVIDPCAEFSTVVTEWLRGPFLQSEWVPADAPHEKDVKLDVDHAVFQALWEHGQCPPDYCLERWARHIVKFATHTFIDLTGYTTEPIKSLSSMRKVVKGIIDFTCTKPAHVRACLLLCMTFPRHVRRVDRYRYTFDLDNPKVYATISCIRRPDIDLITLGVKKRKRS